ESALRLLRQGQANEGLVRLGGLLRIAADLSDPVLAVGPEGWPAGLAREDYPLFAAHLARMPVGLDDPQALELKPAPLPARRPSVDRGGGQVPVTGAELLGNGRVADHRRLDYRSPAWAMASLAYSRGVTAAAATWLAVWREANGDTTHQPRAREVKPDKDAPP